MEISDEKILVEKAKTDPLAFGQLYDHYYSKISNYILRRVGNTQIAQDITSEVFFKIMKSLPKFEWREISFSSWLYKIAINETYTYFRRKSNKHFSLTLLFEKHNFEVEDTIDIEHEYIESEELRERHKDFIEIKKHLYKLPQKYQEVLILRFFEKKKLSEISQIIGKNLNTVKTLQSRGLDLLRESYFHQKEDQLSSLDVKPFVIESVIKVEDRKI